MTLSKPQIVMNDFLNEYNKIQPHESLNMETSNSVHVKSNRSNSKKKITFEYPLHFKLNKICKNGVSRWEVIIGSEFLKLLLVDILVPKKWVMEFGMSIIGTYF